MQKGFRTLLVRLGKLRVRKNFLRRRVFLRNLHIYNQSQTRGRTFLTFEGKFSAGCSKLHSRCQGEKFEEKLFLLKKINSKNVFGQWRKNFGKCENFFSMVLINTIVSYICRGTYWEKMFQLENWTTFLSLSDFEQIISRGLAKKFRQLSKTAF